MNPRELAAAGIFVPRGDEGAAPSAMAPPAALEAGAASSLVKATDYEAKTVVVTQDQLAQFAEIDVYQFNKRWRGCDVYVSLDVAASGWPASGRLSVFVWAISAQGERTLVASGRFGQPNTGDPASAVPSGRRVVAARAIAERYVVSVFYDSSGAVPTGRINVTCVGADEVDVASPWTGSLRFGWSTGKYDWSISPQIPRAKLIWIAGSCGAAGGRWLMLRGGSFGNGNTPDLAWAMGANPGEGFVDDAVDFRAPLTSNSLGRFLIAPSSTIGTLTLAVDSFYSFVLV